MSHGPHGPLRGWRLACDTRRGVAFEDNTVYILCGTKTAALQSLLINLDEMIVTVFHFDGLPK